MCSKVEWWTVATRSRVLCELHFKQHVALLFVVAYDQYEDLLVEVRRDDSGVLNHRKNTGDVRTYNWIETSLMSPSSFRHSQYS